MVIDTGYIYNKAKNVEYEKVYTAFCLVNCKGNCTMPGHLCEKAELFRKLIKDNKKEN